MDAHLPPMETADYDLMASFSPGSLGAEQDLMVDLDGNSIPESNVLWYMGKFAFDFLTDSKKLSGQPLPLLTMGNDLINALNSILCELPPDLLKHKTKNSTIEKDILAYCCFQQKKGFRSPCELVLFLDLLAFAVQHKEMFCAEAYAMLTLVTLNDFPAALENFNVNLICYTTQMANQAVAEIQKKSPAVMKAGLFSKKANAIRHRKNNADKQKAITHFLKNRGEPKYRTKSQAIDTMIELDDFRGSKFSTLQRWFNGL